MTACANCQSPQGPFTRTVLALTPGTLNLPAKNQRVLVTCGFRRRNKPSPDERKARTVACNQRRRALEEGQ